MPSAVYLIHFEAGLPITGNRYAQHYIGFVENGHTLHHRMACHRNGSGSRLMAAVSAAGIDWHMVRMWEDCDRYFERKLKRQRTASMYCPVCAVERGQRLRQPRMPWRPQRSTARELAAMRAGLAWWRSRQAVGAQTLALLAARLAYVPWEAEAWPIIEHEPEHIPDVPPELSVV